jgi:hypothetical protein
MNQGMVSKQSILLFVCLFAGLLYGFSQTTKEVFSNSETPILWLGIDFTKARVIEDPSAQALEIRDRYYDGINEVLINEPKKYALKDAFHKSNMDHDLGVVAKRNARVNTEEIKSSNLADFHRLKESDIIELVKGFDFGDKKGIGLLFVMEGMNKPEKAASVWVTLIDMKNKKVLLTDRVEGKTSVSFGFRNYWATSIRSVIDNIEKKKYKEWQQKYS